MAPQNGSGGQKSGIKLTVDPTEGNIGTSFLFYAEGYKPSAKIKVIISDPKNKIIYEDWVTADKKGNIGYGKLQLQAKADWKSGFYQFKASGIPRGDTNYTDAAVFFSLK